MMGVSPPNPHRGVQTPRTPHSLWLVVVSLIVTETAGADQWYLSNAAGMALTAVSSRTAALRNPYCLSIETVSQGEISEELQGYLLSSYQVERHSLYQKGELSRVRWIFRDSAGTVRLVSALGDRGFIEIYDASNRITEEHEFSPEGSERITQYFYQRQVLVKAEIRLEEELIATDQYRYSRSQSLRAVERVYHASETPLRRLQFPSLGLNNRIDESFITPGTPFRSEFLQDIMDTKPGDQVVYNTDPRGKVLTETRRDAEGEIQGEIRNIWAGDRLEAVEWKAGEDERRTEYEYDSAGEQILERNYSKGVLERTVRREKGQEIEELYMHGAVILRAIWENGRKISEEHIRKKP